MGTFVLKPIDLYRAYLAGYFSETAKPNEPMVEVTSDQVPIAEAEAMAANALGAHDRERRADKPPRTLRQLVADVRHQLAEEQEPAAALDLDLAAMVNAVRLGSWTTAENIAIVVRSKYAIPADKLADLMTLCEARAREHNAGLEQG